MRQVSLKSGHIIMHISVWFHDQGVLLQVNTGITLQMTSWHNTDIHTNTVRTNFNHFSTLPQNLVLLWWILFEKYFFKHSNPISSVVSEIKSGVRGSYAAEKVGTLKVKVQCAQNVRKIFPPQRTSSSPPFQPCAECVSKYLLLRKAQTS